MPFFWAGIEPYISALRRLRAHPVVGGAFIVGSLSARSGRATELSSFQPIAPPSVA